MRWWSPESFRTLSRKHRNRSTLESAILYATREDWARVQDEFTGLADKFASLKVQLLPEGPLPWLARNLAATDAVNLLQGEFARSTDYGERWRRWRTAALLAAALLVAHVAAAALEIHRANRETAALDTEIAQVFSQAMPTEAMQDPRRQMQSRLERIRRSGAGPEYFLRTLEALSGAIFGHAEHHHRYAQLSRANARFESDGTESRSALSAVSAGGQTRSDGRNTILDAGGRRH